MDCIMVSKSKKEKNNCVSNKLFLSEAIQTFHIPSH